MDLINTYVSLGTQLFSTVDSLLVTPTSLSIPSLVQSIETSVKARVHRIRPNAHSLIKSVDDQLSFLIASATATSLPVANPSAPTATLTSNTSAQASTDSTLLTTPTTFTAPFSSLASTSARATSSTVSIATNAEERHQLTVKVVLATVGVCLVLFFIFLIGPKVVKRRRERRRVSADLEEAMDFSCRHQRDSWGLEEPEPPEYQCEPKLPSMVYIPPWESGLSSKPGWI